MIKSIIAKYKDEKFYLPFVRNNDYFKNPSSRFLIEGERDPTQRIQQLRHYFKKSNKTETILDIGCNIGLISHFLSKEGFHVTGIENNVHNTYKKFAKVNTLSVARELNHVYGSNATFVEGNYLALVGLQSFDHILYLSVWHHHFLNSYGQNFNLDKNMEILDTVINAANKSVIFEYDYKVCKELDSFKKLQAALMARRNDVTVTLIASNNDVALHVPSYRFSRDIICIKKKEKPARVPLATIINTVQDITVIIKTIDRQESAINLLKSIRKFYPKIKIIIADDSDDGEKLTLDSLEPFNVKLLRLPPNSGVSFGRNQMISHVDTQYILLCDDDFIFTDETNLEKGLKKLIDGCYDMVGFELKGNYKTSYHRKTFKRWEHDNSIRLESTADEKCDFILNFFLARKDKLKPYDPELPTYEHFIYFYDNWISSNPMKICMYPEVVANHEHCGSQKYYTKRRRSLDVLGHAIHKRGLNAIFNCNNAEYKSLPPIEISERIKLFTELKEMDDPVEAEVREGREDTVVPKLKEIIIHKSDKTDVKVWIDHKAGIIVLPKAQRDWTSNGHIYGVAVDRQDVLKTGKILDILKEESLKRTLHRNIMGVYDYDKNSVCCEYIDGYVLCNKNKFTPLSDKLKPCFLDYDVRVDFADLVAPIKWLHRKGIAYTDVSTFNYMVTRHGIIKLIDLLSCVPITEKLKLLDNSRLLSIKSELLKLYGNKLYNLDYNEE